MLHNPFFRAGKQNVVDYLDRASHASDVFAIQLSQVSSGNLGLRPNRF